MLYVAASAIALAWLAGYAAACWWWPFAACRKCNGTGKRKSPSGRAFRICRRCKGSARRLRAGRRIFNWLRVLHKEGT